MAKLLTKSKYMNGLESEALLWIVVNQKELLPEVNEETQAKFDAGKEIEILARKLHQGIDLSEIQDFMENINQTKKAIQERKTIYEAGIMINRLYIRSDVLIPNEDGTWDLIEIKGTTKVKKSHIKDLSFQKHVLELTGMKIRNCFVIHLNNQYVRKDFLDIGLLFTRTDITKQVNEEIKGIQERIEHMLNIIDLPDCPMFDYRDITKSEYGNPLIDQFLEELPEHNVFELYNIQKAKAIELLDQNIVLIKQIPQETLTEKQEIQQRTIITNEAHINKEAIKKFTDKIKYPIAYLDFETIQHAIPKYENTKAYQQIPFQYCVYVEEENGETKKYEYIYEGKEDPREEFTNNLKEAIKTANTIITYNESFEIYRLKELAKTQKEHEEWINDAIKKIIDLMEPFNNFSYHHKDQRGSCSLKNITPLFSEQTHKDLNIKEGSDASRQYLKNYGNITQELKENLLRYCELDSKAMMLILNKLKKITQ